MGETHLGWTAIVRLGFVQTALGAIIVLMTSTINRVLVVELALPAIVPGLLIASHYAVQILRPVWGHGSDTGGRRTPWILAGMALLALGGFGAACGVALAERSLAAGLALCALSFILVGAGAGAAGTSVLAMLASRVAPNRRAAAATTVWIMMIFGFAVTAPLAGRFLDPFSYPRLMEVTGVVCAAAFALAAVAVWGVERGRSAPTRAATAPFGATLRRIWAEPAARRFTIFLFVSMLAYSAQELLVEPFAGLVFGLAPGVTTKLAGLQHGGVLLGMVFVAAAASRRPHALTAWTIAGCLGSALALAAVAASGLFAGPAALRAAVFCLGLANGIFAVAAIGSMMGLAGAGEASREGVRMGIWGAAQAIAFGLGGIAATGLVDVARAWSAPPVAAYALVFLAEAAAFVAAAFLAAGPNRARAAATRLTEAHS